MAPLRLAQGINIFRGKARHPFQTCQVLNRFRKFLNISGMMYQITMRRDQHFGNSSRLLLSPPLDYLRRR